VQRRGGWVGRDVERGHEGHQEGTASQEAEDEDGDGDCYILLVQGTKVDCSVGEAGASVGTCYNSRQS